MVGLGLELRQFLVNLASGSRSVRPVKANAGSTPLQFCGSLERRQGKGNACKSALVGACRAFLGLDRFPQMMAAMLGISEDVRVTALHLVADAIEHILDCEQAGFLGHLR